MIDVVLSGTQPRLLAALQAALSGLPHHMLPAGAPLQHRRVLFALSTDACGMEPETLGLLRRLRADPAAMEGSTAALLIDGESELYTKQLAQEMALAASQAGCTLPGKPLVEGAGLLYNQHILAARRNLSWEETYFVRAHELAERLTRFKPPRFARPRLLALHASEYGRSTTLWLWQQLRARLEADCDIQEIALLNGAIYDCRGCSYSACLHFARNDTCFYGGAISETVLPAIRDSDILFFLCPNYNDAVAANITALFNRLTSLLLHSTLYDKYLYGLVVSGYSGGDLVARQLLGAMCLNKTAMLPPRFCMMQTANDLATAQALPNLSEQLDRFAAELLRTVKQP